MTNPFAKSVDGKKHSKKKLAILFALLLSGGIASYYLSLGDCGYMEVSVSERMLTIYTPCEVQVTVAEPPAMEIRDGVVYLTIPEGWSWQVIPP